MRTNFSTCGVGNRVFVFGGEGADATAFFDLFELDLDAHKPRWQLVEARHPFASPAFAAPHTPHGLLVTVPRVLRCAAAAASRPARLPVLRSLPSGPAASSQRSL